MILALEVRDIRPDFWVMAILEAILSKLLLNVVAVVVVVVVVVVVFFYVVR